MPFSVTCLYFCKVEGKVVSWREGRVLKEVDKVWNNNCGKEKRVLLREADL